MSVGFRVCLIGFGEVGQVLAEDLTARGASDLSAWDVLFVNPASNPSRALANGRVRAASSAADAVGGADVVISAVTAAQDVEAARAAAAALARDAWFLDLNSVSPEVKRAAARLIESHGGRYVEAAVMAPVPPKRLATSMLLGGRHAATFMAVAEQLGFTGARVFSAEVGRASAAKMCRSVMVKGIEALLAESLLAARHYGVEDAVLASLRDLFPLADWQGQARYMISRSLVHGRRRAEEMREVARTVEESGITPSMSAACAIRQDWAAHYRDAADEPTLDAMLDSILAATGRERAR